MRRAGLVVLALLLVVAACTPKQAPIPTPVPQAPAPVPASVAAPVPGAPAKPAWEAEWQKTLAAAKREGTVVLLQSSGGSVARVPIMEGFKKAYGISVESVVAGGAQMARKTFSERQAGIYTNDVLLAGANTTLNVLKPAGVLDHIDPALMLPDVTDPELIKKIWWQGKLYWIDADHTMLAPAFRLNFSIAINTNLVKEGQIKSYRDLLDSKWQGKLVFGDPGLTGGLSSLSFIEGALGWDYLVELVAKTKPIVLDNPRLEGEWLAHGKVALIVNPETQGIVSLTQLGAPVKGIFAAEGIRMGAGANTLSIFNRPAHPNATKLFVNWYLSKEGQSVVVVPMAAQSSRLDVPTDHLPPDQIRQPGVKYFVQEDEKVLLAQPALQKKAKELFDPLMSK